MTPSSPIVTIRPRIGDPWQAVLLRLGPSIGTPKGFARVRPVPGQGRTNRELLVSIERVFVKQWGKLVPWGEVRR